MNARAFGWVLLVFGVVASAQQIIAGVPHVVLAFCYLGVLIAALGFLIGRTELVYAYVSAGLIAQIPYAIDLVRVYLDLPQLFGFVRYNPSYFTLAGRIVDLGVHLVTLPIALVGLFGLRVPSYRLIARWHLLLAMLVFIISWIVGVNCTTNTCFEPLPFGETRAGHIVYLLLAWIVLPLTVAVPLRSLHRRFQGRHALHAT